jgi:hypothetical protein
VDSPIFNGECRDMPSERTTHGELPSPVTTKNASPIPNIVRPNTKITSRCMWCLPTPNDQVESARHGVFGIVREGLRKLATLANQFLLSLVELTAKLYLI